MNLSQMSFDNGILHLANWAGNVIMPTLAALFIIAAILQFSKGQEFSHSMGKAPGEWADISPCTRIGGHSADDLVSVVKGAARL